jgi:hypothetical protein
MGRVRIPYYVVRNGRGYWQPKKHMRALGFECTACGDDGPEAHQKAMALNAKWKEFSRRDTHKQIAPKRGSISEAFARYKATPEWTKKADRTREEWERAWRRIEPIFGEVAPRDVTLDQISRFREIVAGKVSQREAHRVIKIWRALWKVAASMRYCAAGADPSLGVRNTEPERRQAVWTYEDARLLVRGAWDQGYHGLAAIIAVAWDSSLSPVDVRKLTLAQRSRDGRGDVFAVARAKTGRAAVATLSRAARRVLDAYLASLGASLTPDAPIFRNRSGRPYSKDTLGDDFRDVRAIVFGEGESRTLADFRRSGAVEALRGGASLDLVGQKLANDVGSNPSLGRTYVPVDLEAVRKADAARKKGRK